ncbi:MAG: AMP-binding protein [Chloroflexi bacterium]|nr:AMP-binding protein [Chloroflexota bacterium]
MAMTLAECDTFPKIIKYYYEKHGDKKVAIRYKQYGIWRKFTWKDFYETIKYFALGMVSLGLTRGERVLVIGDNEPEWLYAAFATQAAGGAFVGGFADSHTPEIQYYMTHSDARFVVAEDQEQVDKVLLFKDDVPDLQKIIYWDPKGLWSYDDPLLMPFEDVLNLGREYEKEHPGFFEESVARGKGDDLAQFAYTSGTTAQPKGAVHTHNTLMKMARSWQIVEPLREEDNILSFVPLGWAAEWVCNEYMALVAGSTLNFPEEPETMQSDIRELGVDYAFISPKLLEVQIGEVETNVADSTTLKKFLYHLLMPVGYKMAHLKIDKEEINLFWKILYKIAYLILFRQIRDRIGYLKVRVLYTAGSIIAPESYYFYHGIGVNLKNAYGITESGGCPVVHRDGDINIETTGLPTPGVEVRVTDGGDVHLRTPGILVNYHKNPEAYTKSVSNGWLLTGDSGFMRDDGHLIIFDRSADLMTTSDGTKFSPQYIESKIRVSRYIKEAIVFGNNRPFATCLVSIDYGTVGKWAEENHLTYTTYTDLSQKPEVYQLILKDLKRVNRGLSDTSKIKKYALLHKELDADDAELSRVRKLRRGYVEDTYRAQMEALYSDEKQVMAETVITYRDGRTKDVKIAIRIAFVE